MAHQVEKLKEDWYQNFPLFFAHGAAKGKGLQCCVKMFKTHIHILPAIYTRLIQAHDRLIHSSRSCENLLLNITFILHLQQDSGFGGTFLPSPLQNARCHECN